jgi:hypothetical protein
MSEITPVGILKVVTVDPSSNSLKRFSDKDTF